MNRRRALLSLAVVLLSGATLALGRSAYLGAKAMAAGVLIDRALAANLSDGVKDRIRKRSKGRFFAPRKLAERVPYEVVSLLMLGLLLAVYVVLQLAQPAQLRLP